MANKYWYCSVLLLLISFPSLAQSDISGRVVDEVTNAPVENANIFFNNTTINTYTDINGEFHFDAIRMFNSEFVIYAKGYELLVYKTSPTQVEGKRILFRLKAKEKVELTKVNFKSFERKTYQSFFKQELLGMTEEAKASIIRNEETIYFVNAGRDGDFMALADTPLVIINSLLGYRIIYYLLECWYNDSTSHYHFTGYTRYEDLGTKKKWLRNRERSYYGSTLHFFRSLVARKLYSENFATGLMKTEKDTAAIYGTTSLVAPEITIIQPLSESDILSIDDKTNELSINIGKERMLVQYNKDPYLKTDLINNGLVNYTDKGVGSIIIFKELPAGIKYPGVLDDYENIEYSGYWEFERLANKLPFDYELPKHYR